MKLFAFVDTHGNLSKINALKEKSKGADLVICAGDLTMFESNLNGFLKVLDGLGPRVLIVHGNHEEELTLKRACKPQPKIFDIHKEIFKTKDYVFMGFGGGGFSMVDEEFENLEEKFKKHLKDNSTVLIVHGPPYGTALDYLDNRHVGNKSYRDFIIKYHPKLVICGHLHENAGKKDKIGDSIIVNPGPDGVMLDI